MMTNEQFTEMRRKMRVSQGRVARRAGVSQTLVSQYELGNLSLSPAQVADLKDALREELDQMAKDAARKAREARGLIAQQEGVAV